ncbi:MAG: class I SAM-dependent methyltransferase [Candidatus Micrarchaeia archaeon]
MAKFEKKVKAKYNDIANTYFSFRITGKAVHNEYLEMPAMFAELGNLHGKKVLDVGCGPGLHAAMLAKSGAIVYGIDQSEKMIELAKKHTPGANFIVGDIYHMPYKSEFFDAAFASYVVHYFSDLDSAFKEIRRVMKKGGIFVYSITNPFKEVTHHLPGRPFYMRKFENYFDEGERKVTWFKNTKNESVIPFIHRTFETYIKSALRNGFEIIDYLDAKPLPTMKDINKHIYDYAMHIPQLCVFKLEAV